MAAAPLAASASWLGMCPVRSASSSCATSSSVAAFAMAACSNGLQVSGTPSIIAGAVKHWTFCSQGCSFKGGWECIEMPCLKTSTREPVPPALHHRQRGTVCTAAR